MRSFIFQALGVITATVFCLPSIAAAESTTPSTEAVSTAGQDVLDDAAIASVIAQSATLTTTAQRFHFREHTLAGLEGKQAQVTLTVRDVKPVTWREQSMFSIEASNADPAYRLEIYTNAEAALALNVGDQVSLAGQLVGIRLGKNTVVAIENGSVVAPPTQP